SAESEGLSVTVDPVTLAELSQVLQSGQAVVMCRCGSLGSLELRRPDGSEERVLFMPAHDEESVEFRAGKGRFRVNRERFLRVVRNLPVLSARWYSVPDG